VRKFTTLLGVGLVLAFVALPAVPQAGEADRAQLRGAELQREGDLQGALREFDRAVKLAPDSALAWYNRGLVRRALGDCRAAVPDFDRALELRADFFNALYQRGNCLQALGDYGRAVDDYGRAITLPGRIDARFLAHFGRADALRRAGRLDEAYGEYTRVRELRSDTTALRSRAWVSFYRGRWADAYDDAAKYVHDTQAKEPDAAYAVILGVLALRRAARSQDAAAFLQQWEPQLDRATWPAPVIAYLKGGDARVLLAAAKQPAESTEARAYLGADLLAQGKKERGVEILWAVLRDGEPGYLEYDLAYHELRRLGLASPADRRQAVR
jgi:tetratricopeptide (TPR) repeat protein